MTFFLFKPITMIFVLPLLSTAFATDDRRAFVQTKFASYNDIGVYNDTTDDRNLQEESGPKQAKVPEGKRTYSSIWNDDAIGTRHARSVIDSPQAWSTKNNKVGEWMQIDLGKPKMVSGVIVQGRHGTHQGQRVTKTKVSYSTDGNKWTAAGEFDAAKDPDTTVPIKFSKEARARYVRFLPTKWSIHMSMRGDVLVAAEQPANAPESSRTYSSIWNNDAIGTRHARSVIGSPQAWSAKNNEVGEWMQIDLGKPKTVSGAIVQGRHGTHQGQRVTKTKVSYSTDGNKWTATGEFDAAKDPDTTVPIKFSKEAKARYVRFLPTKWSIHMSMRGDVLLAEDDQK